METTFTRSSHHSVSNDVDDEEQCGREEHVEDRADGVGDGASVHGRVIFACEQKTNKLSMQYCS